MKKTTNYQFEATRNKDGEYVCETYTEMQPEENGETKSTAYSSHQSYQTSREDKSNQNHQSTNYDSADEIFNQTYMNNIYSGNANYIDNMRQEFEQMRRSMLNQMENFTFIQNIGK